MTVLLRLVPGNRQLQLRALMIVKPLNICLVTLASALFLAGCSTLPDSGPTKTEIEDGAQDHNQIGFKLVDVTPSILAALDSAAKPSMRQWNGQAPNSVTRVGIGDVLSVTIFVAGGGSFSAAPPSGQETNGSGGIQSQNLPPLQVDEHGNITIPYAGTLHVSGRTPTEIQAMINKGLSGTVFRPQTIVDVSRNLRNTVVVSGDVRKPGRYPIEIAGQRLRDVITQAGGPAFTQEDMIVSLSRHGSSVQVPLTQVDDSLSEDIPLQPGDDIQLLYRPRTFLSFGAGGRVTQVKFDSDKLSLAEGIARIGGPADDRADPTAVYLFRFEQPQVMANLGMPAVQTPVIYQVNMLDPQSYFELQKIAMRDKDLVYVANARSNKFFRFLSLINGVFIPIGTTYNITHG